MLTAKILYLNLARQLKVKYCWYVYCKSCDYKAKQWKGSCPMPLIRFCEIRMNSHLSAFWLKIAVIMYIRFAQHFTDICFGSSILHYSGRCLCRWQKKHLWPTLIEFTNFLETGLELHDGIIHQNRFCKMSITVMLAKICLWKVSERLWSYRSADCAQWLI